MKNKTSQIYPWKFLRNGPVWRPNWDLHKSLTKAGFLIFLFKFGSFGHPDYYSWFPFRYYVVWKKIFYLNTGCTHSPRWVLRIWCFLSQRLILFLQLALTWAFAFFLCISLSHHYSALFSPQIEYWWPNSLPGPDLEVKQWQLILLARKAEPLSLLAQSNSF